MNGDYSGSQYLSKRLEAIEIKLVPKGTFTANNTTDPFLDRIIYQAHIQDVGWQDCKYNGELSGTSGRSLRLEGIKIYLPQPMIEKGYYVEYKTHVQNIGWQDWSKNGALSGTSGQSLRLEGISIRLGGGLENTYDIYYRVHIQDYGWLGWAKNGENSGSEGLSKRLEAIEIKLVKKNSNETAPTSDVVAYKTGWTNNKYQFIQNGRVYYNWEAICEEANRRLKEKYPNITIDTSGQSGYATTTTYDGLKTSSLEEVGITNDWYEWEINDCVHWAEDCMAANPHRNLYGVNVVSVSNYSDGTRDICIRLTY